MPGCSTALPRPDTHLCWPTGLPVGVCVKGGWNGIPTCRDVVVTLVWYENRFGEMPEGSSGGAGESPVDFRAEREGEAWMPSGTNTMDGSK